MRMRPVLAVAVVITLAGLHLPDLNAAAADELPRIRLVATGGTISNRTGGRLTADQLVGLIPDVPRYARVETEQFANTASSALTLEQWLALSTRLNALFASDPGLGGLVVTSGTDTLEELAYFLHLTVRDDRPVVVVGSMRNASSVGYEGAANLLEAFRVAADAGARGMGVLVVLNDEINSAREVTKTDALRLQTFQSRPAGVLGVVDQDRVVFYRAPVKRHTARSEFDVSGITALPRVDVVLTYQGAPGDLIRAAVDYGARGVVVAAAGAGATSGTQGEGVAYAAGKGVAVVIATRTGSGRVPGASPLGAAPRAERPSQASASAAGAQAPMPARPRRATIGGEDLMPLKARILLMLALTRTSDPADIQRMFLEY